MTDDATRDADVESFLEQMTDTYVSAMEKNLDAQLAFVDSWTGSMEDALSDEQIQDGVEGSLRAYEAWMDAAESSVERLSDAFEGDEVTPEEFRDIWLSAANQAFKESMATTAYAAATGQQLDDVLDVRRQLDQATEETLHGLGFATTGDVREVGERLVAVERRQHAIEGKLDRLLDQLDAEE